MSHQIAITTEDAGRIRLEQLREEIAALGITGYRGAVQVSLATGELYIEVDADSVTPEQEQRIRDVIAAHAPQPPAPDAELVAIAGILDKADSAVTAGELKTLALAALRRMRKRGALG